MCKADTVGPLTFGNGFPFAYDGIYTGGTGPQIVPLAGKGIAENSAHGLLFFDTVVPFSFDLASGWSITSLMLHDSVDYNNTPTTADWGYEFAEKVVLCPTVGACSTATTGGGIGTAKLPPLELNAQALAGSGVYEVSGYLLNQQIATNGGIQNLNVGLTSLPEPASLLLLVSGIAGLPFVNALRGRGRGEAPPEEVG
ncbi:MAG TPA: hypothetical protein VK627_09600, partial [Edaphobacter sp.]|nr:hypothetical protein [Edaphobacter sp.]